MNLLFTGASQPSYAANRHVIAQLSRTLINALVSVDQVRIPADVEHSGFCIKVTACWVKRSSRRVSSINGEMSPR